MLDLLKHWPNPNDSHRDICTAILTVLLPPCYKVRAGPSVHTFHSIEPPFLHVHVFFWLIWIICFKKIIAEINIIWLCVNIIYLNTRVHSCKQKKCCTSNYTVIAPCFFIIDGIKKKLADAVSVLEYFALGWCITLLVWIKPTVTSGCK